ncbi:MAG: hypothetical protein D6723_03070 [Acidobacteria bacterium]|nr:MAG: hypothetical protein D6723_03070 [Acidobacteriota bacterium]
MLTPNKVDGILGALLGSLGAALGILGTLAERNPQRYLGKLRALVWLSISVGWLLSFGGAILYFRAGTDHYYGLASLLYTAAMTPGILALACGRFFDDESPIHKFIHAFPIGGSALLVLGIHSHWAHGELWRCLNLLGLYGVALLWHRVIDRRRAKSRP